MLCIRRSPRLLATLLALGVVFSSDTSIAGTDAGSPWDLHGHIAFLTD